MTNLVTIYELFDPRAPAIVRYVGKAKDREVIIKRDATGRITGAEIKEQTDE